MSIRLSMGVRFAQPDAEALNGALAVWREEVAALGRAHRAAFLAKESAACLDRRLLGIRDGEDQGEPPVVRARARWDTEQAAGAKGFRHPETDLAFKVVTFAFENAMYGLVFTERHTWRTAMMERLGADDFGFSDGERPAGISAKAWRERERVWEGILKPDWIPANHGEEFDFTPADDPPDDAAVAAAFPDVVLRAKDRSREILLSAKADEFAEGSRDFQKMVSAVTRAACWLVEPEGLAEWRREQARVAAILPGQISIADLTGPVSLGPSAP